MKKSKGFTLAELLIVVAIIAVLVAISIPIFTAQLEKARESTDAANIRAAYAEQVAALLGWDGTDDALPDDIDVDAVQTQEGWQGTDYSSDSTIGGQNVDASTTGWTISCDDDGEGVTIEAK